MYWTRSYVFLPASSFLGGAHWDYSINSFKYILVHLSFPMHPEGFPKIFFIGRFAFLEAQYRFGKWNLDPL
jgi:hypothetical protein